MNQTGLRNLSLIAPPLPIKKESWIRHSAGKRHLLYVHRRFRGQYSFARIKNKIKFNCPPAVYGRGHSDSFLPLCPSYWKHEKRYAVVQRSGPVSWLERTKRLRAPVDRRARVRWT